MKRTGKISRIASLTLLLGLKSMTATPAGVAVISVQDPVSTPGALKLLFFGYQENNQHSPSAVFSALSPGFSSNGVDATFTSSQADLNSTNLNTYDALMMYGNFQSSGISSPNQPLVPVIIDYVEDGGALVGLHVASAAFRNDTRFAALLGGRFEQHFRGEFTPENTDPEHPLTKGLTPLTSWDETYILKDLNPDITILQERVNSPTQRYAWTWTRTQGAGRVFYTASGHVPGDGNTDPYNSITKPEFSDLVLRGLQWSTKRHFTSLSHAMPGTSQTIWGEGTHRGTGDTCLWLDNGSGPVIIAVEGDPITIGAETFFWNEMEPGKSIAHQDSSNSLTFFRPITSPADEVVPALWKSFPDGSVEAWAVGGQPFPLQGGTESVESLGEIVGRGFVGNKTGHALFRAILKNDLSLTTRSTIIPGDTGVILGENDPAPGLAGGITIGSLADGPLTMNDEGNFALTAPLSNSLTTIVTGMENSVSIPLVEGDPVEGLTNVQWSSFQGLSLTNGNELFFTAGLTGNVSPGDDSVLVKYSLADQQLAIVLREGHEVTPSGFIGDLTSLEFVPGHHGDCHFFTELTGPAITQTDDRALISVTDSTRIIAREGDSLPTLEAGAVIGPDLGNSPLAVDDNGKLYFTATVVNGGDSRAQLFLAEDLILFGALSAGETIPDGPGINHTVASISPFRPTGIRGGFPSPVSGDQLTLEVETDTAHRLVLHLEGLTDLDQDGTSNLLEAGLGSDPSDPGSTAIFPSIENEGGDRYYTFLRATTGGLPVPTLEESIDLRNWGPSPASMDLWGDQSDVPAGYEKVGVPLNQFGSDQHFLRLSF